MLWTLPISLLKINHGFGLSSPPPLLPPHHEEKFCVTPNNLNLFVHKELAKRELPTISRKKIHNSSNSPQIPNTPQKNFKLQPNAPQVEAKPITLYLHT
jgi:hypothetical protein